MPTIFDWKGYKFFFFSNEGIPREPCHIHIRKSGNIAKFWVVPDIRLAESWGMNSKELKELEIIIEEKKFLIKEKWDEFFPM